MTRSSTTSAGPTVSQVCSMLRDALAWKGGTWIETQGDWPGPVGRALSELFVFGHSSASPEGAAGDGHRSFESVLFEYMVTGWACEYKPWGTESGLLAADKKQLATLLRQTVARPWASRQDVACAFGATVFLVRLVSSKAEAEGLLEFFLSQTRRKECQPESSNDCRLRRPLLETPGSLCRYPGVFAVLEPARQLLLRFPELLTASRIKEMARACQQWSVGLTLPSIVGKLRPQQLHLGIALVNHIYDYSQRIGDVDLSKPTGRNVMFALLAQDLGGGALHYYRELLDLEVAHVTAYASTILEALGGYLKKNCRGLQEAAWASSAVRKQLFRLRKVFAKGRKNLCFEGPDFPQKSLDTIEELLTIALGEKPDPLVAELCAWAPCPTKRPTKA